MFKTLPLDYGEGDFEGTKMTHFLVTLPLRLFAIWFDGTELVDLAAFFTIVFVEISVLMVKVNNMRQNSTKITQKNTIQIHIKEFGWYSASYLGAISLQYIQENRLK